MKISENKSKDKFNQIFFNSKKSGWYFYIILGLIILFLIFFLSFFLWLSYQNILLKNIKGVDKDFFGGFQNGDLNLYDTAIFKPSLIIFSFVMGTTNFSIWVFIAAIIIGLVPWPILTMLIGVMDHDGDDLRRYNYRKFLINFMFIIPGLLLLIIQSPFIMSRTAMEKSFETQFFSTFDKFSPSEISNQLKDQLEIAKNSFCETFNFSTMNFFLISLTIFSIFLILIILIYSIWALSKKNFNTETLSDKEQ